MAFIGSLMVLLVVCFFGIHARPTGNDNAVGVIWTFPNETWIENLAVRRDGSILATSLSRSAVYLVDPFEHSTTTAHQFAPADGVLGITEIEDDVFVVATAHVDLKTSKASPKSAKMWKIDFTSSNHSPCVSHIADLVDATLPDGVLALPEPGLVLVADAAEGVIWRVNTSNGDYEIAIADPAFKTTNQIIPLGVDGIHIADSRLYFTNPGNNLLGRIPIDNYGNPTGPVENVTAKLVFPDDFALRPYGTSFVAGANTLWQVGPNGAVKVLAGGLEDKTLEGVTSAQFGRTNRDRNVLYLGTNGGMLAPVDGEVHGGQILAVNVEILGDSTG